MAEKLFFSPYELKPVAALNARSGAGARRGALLRWEASGRAPGYADLHSWPELGDAPLETHLESLRVGKPTALAVRALELAAVDSEARGRGVSLFAGSEVPESHFLVLDMAEFGSATLEREIAKGFSRFKLKVGRNPPSEAEALAQLSLSAPASVKFRLDFNATLDRAALGGFLERLGPAVLRIDFLEDPIAWDAREWSLIRREWGVRVAADRVFADDPRAFDLQVLKPAIQGSVSRDPSRVVFTSNLDHPVGQAHAAAFAARFARENPDRVEICGLSSQNAYAPNAYSEALGPSAPCFRAPEGSGIGFDAFLERERWELLR